MKWVDSDGIEHLHILRSDDLDDVLKQMRTVKMCIQAAKEKALEQRKARPASEPGPEDPRGDEREEEGSAEGEVPEGFCVIHDVWMKQRKNTKGSWWSHKTAEGWCNGK